MAFQVRLSEGCYVLLLRETAGAGLFGEVYGVVSLVGSPR